MERYARVALVLGLLCVLAACAPARTRQTSQTVRIGAALSLSGPASLIGMAQRSGIRLAQDEINRGHLLGNTRLDVVIQDDQSDREQASVVFQHFIEDGHVVAILGPTLSDAALNVDPLAQQAAIPVLAISNSAGGITAVGDFIFRDNLSESQLTPQVVSAVCQHMQLRRAALLSSDSDPNRAGSHGFKSALQNAGVQITTEQTFSVDKLDISSQLEEIASSQADALFVTAPSSAAASLLKQARRQGLKIPIVGSSAFNSDAVLRSAGDAAEGLIVGSGWSLGNPSPRNQQFVETYRSRFGVDPDQVATQAYSGVYILAAALAAAPTMNAPRGVRDALVRVHDVDTPLGKFSFNDMHDPNYAATVQVVHLGHFEAF